MTSIFVFIVLVGFIFYLLFLLQKKRKEIEKERESSSQKVYEIAILKELGDRIGYSLNVEEILQVIVGSLHQFLDYTAVGYVVITAEKIKISTHLERSVCRSFLTDMKKRMLDSLSALTEKKYDLITMEESISGAIVIDEPIEQIGSFFNIPLVVSGVVAGVLTVAHTRSGLYQEEEMTILYKIVSQVSNAVTRLREVVTSEEEKLMKVREEFTSMIVHELRSPLDSIKKIVELMLSDKILPDSKEFKEYLNITHQSSASMLELVNDILDLSKLQVGKFEVNKEKANIKDLIANRMMFYKISADGRKIALESFLSDNLPAQSDFDPQALKQILNNLLSNALKFTREGGHILVSAFVYDGQDSFPNDIDKSKYSIFPDPSEISIKVSSLCVVVTDTGIGIPEDNLKDLFHTYKQAKISPINKEDKGTGLGLVIAKGIVEAHGGSIGVVSEEGVGTSFFFTIPL